MAVPSLPTPLPPEAIPIGGATRLFFVVGRPVAQVRAPAVINPLLALAGIDAQVVPLDVPANRLMATCRSLLSCHNVGGLLVTVPYKQAVLPLCEVLGAEAAASGAVNALRLNVDGQVEGDLFDGLGFVRGLQAAGHELRGRRVLLLGAGGAGSAIASALASAQVGSLAIFDPTAGRSAALAESLASRHAGCAILSVPHPRPHAHDLIVNATPLGMQAHDPLPLDPEQLDPATLVADVIMKPADTRLLQAARARGCTTHPGRPMLDHQLPAYLRFFGLDAALPFALRQLAPAREPVPA